MKESTNSQAVPADIAEFVVEYDDVRVQYRVCGTGPCVVLLPSLGRDIEDYFDIALVLAARGLRAIMPTPRGMGSSAGPMDGINLHDFARDVVEVLKHDGVKNAVVAGHAFGNWVARVAAIDYPDIVHGVAVLAAAHKHIPPELRSSIDKCMDIDLSTDERLANLQATFFAPGHDASGWLHGWHPDVARAQRRASAATPKEGWWHAGSVPVLDVQADSDVFAPASGAHLLREELGADRVEIVVIENAGHALLPEQPEAVAQALEAFVRKTMA
jgi:pimeloyl-ACP methyl ester carboxylesterase